MCWSEVGEVPPDDVVAVASFPRSRPVRERDRLRDVDVDPDAVAVAGADADADADPDAAMSEFRQRR